MGMFVRMIAVSSLLCAVVFAGSFALGRAERPRVAPGEPLAASLPATAAGPAIPLALGSAPKIALEVPVAQPSTAHARSRVTVVRSVAPVTLPTSAPAASTPAAEAPISTTAPATPASPDTQSSGGSSHGSGATKSGAGGGTSFDSSG